MYVYTHNGINHRWLDLMILKVLSNLNDSVTLRQVCVYMLHHLLSAVLSLPLTLFGLKWSSQNLIEVKTIAVQSNFKDGDCSSCPHTALLSCWDCFSLNCPSCELWWQVFIVASHAMERSISAIFSNSHSSSCRQVLNCLFAFL